MLQARCVARVSSFHHWLECGSRYERQALALDETCLGELETLINLASIKDRQKKL